MQDVMRFMRVPGMMLLLLGVTACDSPSELGSADAEGRTRLSVDNSYGQFGDYVVHINALNTSSLTAEVAQTYDITRSNKSGLVNLVVLQKTEDLPGDKPVKADVKLKAAKPGRVR